MKENENYKDLNQIDFSYTQEIDLIVTPLQLSSARAKDVDFAGLDVYLSAMVTPAPTERSPILSTIQPFTTTVKLAKIRKKGLQ